MSVKSTADENRDTCLKHIDDAIVCLSKIVVEQCEGTTLYKETYRFKLKKAFQELIEIRDSLQSFYPLTI